MTFPLVKKILKTILVTSLILLLSDTSYADLGPRYEARRQKEIAKAVKSAAKKIKIYEASPSPVQDQSKKSQITEILDLKNNPVSLIQIYQGDYALIKFAGLTRFLITAPDIIGVEKLPQEQVKVSAQKIGTSFLHLWDDTRRFTVKIDVLQKPLAPSTLEEKYIKEIKEAGSFKLKYSFDGSISYSARYLTKLHKNKYTYYHGWEAKGDTPYGQLNSTIHVAGVEKELDLTDYSASLLEGNIGPLKHFDLRFFDSDINYPLIILPSAKFRGVRYDQRSHSDKFTTVSFIGQERLGVFPTLNQDLDSNLYGQSFQVKLDENSRFLAGFFGGYGKDRVDKSDRTLGFNFETKKGIFSYGLNVASNTTSYGYVLSNVLKKNDFTLSSAYRDISKNLFTIIGRPTNQGQRGSVFDFDYKISDSVALNSKIDVYEDRLYPRANKIHPMNAEYGFNLLWTPLSDLSLGFDYQFIDNKGKLFPFVNRTWGFNLRQGIRVLSKKINTFFRFQNQNAHNITAQDNDYDNYKIIMGVSVPIIQNLSLTMSDESNWLRELHTGDSSRPRRRVAELIYDSQIGKSNFYTRQDIRYTKEYDTESILSFMAGQALFEATSEFSYKPNSDTSVYLNGRIAKSAPRNSRSISYAEGQVNFGVRLLFDSGLHWNPSGTVSGYVFKDLNGNGVRDPGEPGIDGIDAHIGKTKVAKTNADGYFNFGKISGKAVYVRVDASSFPKGFLASSSILKEAHISQGDTTVVNFGVFPSSEIMGHIFEDVNSNGAYDPGDAPVENVMLSLDNTKYSYTDENGLYLFRKILKGKHSLELNLKTLPMGYLPKTAVKKQVEVFEGISYEQDFPMSASRIISGKIYIGKSTEPLKGVKITCAGQTYISDENGLYVFKNLMPGKYTVKLDETTLPEGVKIKSQNNIEITLGTLPQTEDKIDFILER